MYGCLLDIRKKKPKYIHVQQFQSMICVYIPYMKDKSLTGHFQPRPQACNWALMLSALEVNWSERQPKKWKCFILSAMQYLKPSARVPLTEPLPRCSYSSSKKASRTEFTFPALCKVKKAADDFQKLQDRIICRIIGRIRRIKNHLLNFFLISSGTALVEQ